MSEDLFSPNALLKVVGDHWKEFNDELTKLRALLKPEEPKDELKLKFLPMCMTAFSFARAFFMDMRYWKPDKDCPDPATAKLLNCSVLAQSFVTVMRRIGGDRLNWHRRSYRVIEQAIIELEGCQRWLKRNGLRGWRVCRCDTEADEPVWREVSPREYTGVMLRAVDEADKCRKRLKDEKE